MRKMKRRDFMTLLGGVVLAAPRIARAQQAAKVWRIGIIANGNRIPAHDGLLQGMHELGHVAGRDYITDWRFAGGRYTQFGIFAQDFVQRKTDVNFLGTGAAGDAVRQATRTIPNVNGHSVESV